jgi:hypothetical protein
VAKREPELIDTINFAIRREMTERINRFNRDRCGGFAKNSDIGRYLFDVALTYFGYPSPQAQAQGKFAPQPQPTPMQQSPFQAPMGVAANGR